MGYDGAGYFDQSGGTNTVAGTLAMNGGAYSLSGSGLLSANTIETYSFSQSAGTVMATGSLSNGGTYTQSNGLVTAGLVNNYGLYSLNGGTLSLNGGLANNGVLNGGGGSVTINAVNSIIDLTQGTLENTGGMSLNVGLNSLVLLPAGFVPYPTFRSFNCLGIIHYVGTPLLVAGQQGFAGQGSINDPVYCQGSISAMTGGYINLNNGLILSGSGSVALGNGNLAITNTESGMTSGQLQAGNVYVGYDASGVFTQSGGTNTVTSTLYLGYTYGSTGTYALIGGQLSAALEDLGPSVFQQTGGSNAAASMAD